MSQLKYNKLTIVSKIKDLLIEAVKDLQKKIKLSEYLANNMPYDYHYLSSVFSQLENTTIEQYFITLKIEKIKALLVEGDFSISEISHKCGYSSPAHLTNQFKKLTGLSPSEFKKAKKKLK